MEGFRLRGRPLYEEGQEELALARLQVARGALQRPYQAAISHLSVPEGAPGKAEICQAELLLASAPTRP